MKVVRLLEDMKAELEKEKADDEAVYEELSCWCSKGKEEKGKEISLLEAKIEDLKSAMGEYAAKIEELREGLKVTRTKLREDQEALDSATAIRMKETQAFHGEETDLLGTIQACKQALVVLSKHHPSFEQLRAVAKNLEALKTMQLAKDALSRDKLAVLKAFLQEAEDASAHNSLRRIPGFQSYTPQSGQIFGILQQMQEEFEADLSQAQKEELQAQEEYTALKAAKEEELAAGQKKLAQLEQDDAEYRSKNAEAYDEYNDTQDALEVCQTFLANLEKRCAETDAEYDARMKSRNEELVAIQDTIGILNTDAAFNNFDKTVNAAFLQTKLMRGKALQTRGTALRARAAAVLRRTGNAQLASLAQAVELDAFEKVKAAIDKMVEELSKQQQDEVEHRDWCLGEMHTNKASTEAEYDKKTSLETKITDTETRIEELVKEIEVKTKSIEEMQSEMKKLSEVREAEHADYQETMADQHITQVILEKAINRMKQVYSDYVVELQMQQQQQEDSDEPGAPHIETSGNHTDPGNGPARFTKYEQHAGGDRVITMLEEIMGESKRLEDEAQVAEMDAQSVYENNMKDMNRNIAAFQKGIVDMTEEKATSEQDLTMAKSDLKATMVELEGLNSELGDLKLSCDFVLKNFDARQEARAAEMDALREAKAILSGMK